MIITYLRSSSYGAHEWCPHRYMIEYVLGKKQAANRSADKGNICHKALELLALWKKHTQLGNTTYVDDSFGEIDIDKITPSWAIQKAFDYYQINSIHNFDLKDFKDCEIWMHNILNFKNGVYDPRCRDVFDAEWKFDIEIKKPWAQYKYLLPNGKYLEGYLSLKGTIDLLSWVPDTNQSLLEATDYKTGQRKDWVSGEEKTYKKLQKDYQLRIYHYAIANTFPEHKNLIITIWYAKDGGPYSLCFHEEDLADTEKMIRKKFEEIKACQKPKLNITWKCSKMCGYYKKWEGSDKSICFHLKDEINLKGVDKVTELYGVPDAYLNYGEGGGRKDKNV